ncbi:hypothetical protein ACFYZ9_40110 [Streptomyces sp. NPDC001691]|uniref:hypothetical protein n=1 Tax=Streptomyces sp. NPDC001691 TaxID=3364600 RepID=UPI003678A880
MTTRTVENRPLKVAETGWAKARHTRNKGIRTCLPPVAESDSAPCPNDRPDENLVRGED